MFSDEYQHLLGTQARSVCDCPVPCSNTHYLSTTSYATTTSRNTNQLLNDKRSRDLGSSFIAAREAEQRLDKAIIQTDTRQITSLHSAFTDVLSLITNLEMAVQGIQGHIGRYSRIFNQGYGSIIIRELRERGILPIMTLSVVGMLWTKEL